MAAPAQRLAENPLIRLDVAYLVGRRRPLTDLPLEQQQKIREAYAETNWCPDAYECMGIFTSPIAAMEAANQPGFFFLELPIDSMSPDALGRYGLQDHPTSPASDWYRQTSGSGVNPPTMRLLPPSPLESAKENPDSEGGDPPSDGDQLNTMIQLCKQECKSIREKARAARQST